MELIAENISSLLKSSKELFEASFAFLNEVFDTHDFAAIALSLNGGKDSTAVLFLALYFMHW